MPGTGTITVDHYRFENDDGSESAATALAGEDTNASISAPSDTNVRLRLQIHCTVAATTNTQYNIAVSKNGGGFSTVNAASSNVRGIASANLTDGGNTTNQLSAPTTGYVTKPGVVSQAAGVSGVFSLNVGDITELDFSTVLRSADLSPGDTLDFNLVETAGDAAYIVHQFASNVRLTILASSTRRRMSMAFL